jgi:mutator protein MutT
LIIRDGRVLLIERGRQPLKGFWSIPGGAVETGETLKEAVRREVQEETGLSVKPMKLVEVFERITRDGRGQVEYHYVLLDYLCRPLAGNLRAADDCSDAEWVERRKLRRYRLTEGTLAVIEKAFRMA